MRGREGDGEKGRPEGRGGQVEREPTTQGTRDRLSTARAKRLLWLRTKPHDWCSVPGRRKIADGEPTTLASVIVGIKIGCLVVCEFRICVSRCVPSPSLY